ncbi:MAG: DUF488 domain-containing protein [Candidatus Omnitrophica bacterium]|nr:DUF488 domain-containing protein [Candidatus Omnitrophota bacterium]
MVREVYSLGTSNRTQEAFLKIIKKFHIQRIVDVRRFPTSRFIHFKAPNLKEILNQENIEYVYMGDVLGGYRKEGYRNYLHTEAFLLGLRKLKKLALEKRTCILCCERLYFRCHRRFITKALRGNFRIIHIIEEDKVKQE